MPIPLLDPAPSGKPHDYSLRAIRQEQIKRKIAKAVIRPTEWHNPNQKYLDHRGQGNGGTCTGQSAAYGLRHNYIRLTGDIPTDQERSPIRRDVRDSLEALVDILHEDEISSECLYQIGRKIGNITYPSGGEIRFVARAARDYGYVLESQWHSDKERLHVWDYPPGGRETPDGGKSPEYCAEFAAKHRIKGWAMVGSPDGDASYQEICDAIYDYGWVMCAIPLYSNFSEMEGQEVPVYPHPNGDLAGFHAQIVDGYTPDELDIEHSWYGWCGQHGKLPRAYYEFARSQCVWLVYIDDEETLIGSEIHTSINITSIPPATLTVNDVAIGLSPQKIAVEVGKTYTITASADGYVSQTKTVDDSVSDVSFTLEPSGSSPEPTKGLIQRFVEWLINLFKRK